MEKKKVLFICTHNSARSHMAEGYLNSRYGNMYEAFSAGTEASSVNPYAIRVMNEIGIDISGNRSKKIDEFFGVHMDILVTVCDTAYGACPMFPWADESIHAGFPDPSGASGSEEEIVETFRKVRNEIISFIDTKFA